MPPPREAEKIASCYRRIQMAANGRRGQGRNSVGCSASGQSWPDSPRPKQVSRWYAAIAECLTAGCAVRVAQVPQRNRARP